MDTNDIPRTIETLMNQTIAKINEATSKPGCDVAELEGLTKQASELKQLKEQVAAIQHRLHALSGGNPPKGKQRSSGNFLRELQIEVSQGMINQNLLTLTEAIKRGQLKVGEQLIIEVLPAGDKFSSDVMQPGNKLRERGAIGKFYRSAGVRDGDYVTLRESARGEWQLLKCDSPPNKWSGF